MQITEQLIPVFLHPQAASQFPSSGGAGSAVLVIGSSPRLVCRQPHLCGSLKNPSQAMAEELSKERAAREALKEVVSAAESMLRVARARMATLERQLKDTRAELDAARRKHKDLEQLVNRLAHEHSHNTYRHRETSYDARSKKLLEVSKTGEMTIEALSRQRDALELRVKELREQTEMAERAAEAREAEQRARADSLQAKVVDQEKSRLAAESRAAELDVRVKELEEQLHALRERSVRLVDMERRRCLEYVPSKGQQVVALGLFWTPAVIKAVKARIQRNPKRKQKLLALQMGLSRTTAKRVLTEDLGLRAYRRKTGLRLNARLMDLRLKRCRALLMRAPQGILFFVTQTKPLFTGDGEEAHSRTDLTPGSRKPYEPPYWLPTEDPVTLTAALRHNIH
ncbi:hypothetical protein evm_014819 [Chilo suppressalis]|nr:hypothetical protein evm_014819 [Chilo suppressalis]